MILRERRKDEIGEYIAPDGNFLSEMRVIMEGGVAADTQMFEEATAAFYAIEAECTEMGDDASETTVRIPLLPWRTDLRLSVHSCSESTICVPVPLFLRKDTKCLSPFL